MALLTRQPMVEAGLNAAYVAAAGGGDTVDNDGRTFLHVKNGGGGSINVTVSAQVASVQDPRKGILTRSNIVVAVTNAQERFIGPFPPSMFNDASGRILITYSGVTSVTVAAVQAPIAPAA